MLTFDTKRLILRRFQAGDVEPLHREVYSDLEVLRHYNGGRVFTVEELRQRLAGRPNSGQLGYWTVTLIETGEVLGQVHLDPYINLGWHRLPEEFPPLCSAPEVHLGFAFGRRFWGQGYATEACQALIRYAFRDLRLFRLLGGAGRENSRSVRLHERLGFRLHVSEKDVTAVLTHPLASYKIRPFEEKDREAAKALGTPVLDWWHREVPGASLHLVAEESATSAIVGHLQARDRGVPEPSHRPGQCHFTLDVSPNHRRRGIGGCLYEHAEAFAVRRQARLLYCAFREIVAAPALTFLGQRGFSPLERFLHSSLDLDAFYTTQFEPAVARVTQQGIVLTTYAKIGDSPDQRRRVYTLETAARSAQPFREIEPYVAPSYVQWEKEFCRRDLTTLFLALAPGTGEPIGVIIGLEGEFTGTHPSWSGRGIATALKVQCLAEAKRRGIRHLTTENHESNAAMLTINRRLGFVFSDPEVAHIKRLPTAPATLSAHWDRG